MTSPLKALIAFIAATLAVANADRLVAVLECINAPTLASNDYLTIAEFVAARGVECDTKTVGDALNVLYPNGYPAGSMRELSDWQCHPDVGLVVFS